MRTFKIDDHTAKIIESMRADLGYESDIEVLKRAITLLKLASDAKKIGGKTIIDMREVEL